MFLYVLLVFDNFSQYGWVIVLQSKNVTEGVNAFRTVEGESKRKPKLLETDDGKKFANKTLQKKLSKQNSKVL